MQFLRYTAIIFSISCLSLIVLSLKPAYAATGSLTVIKNVVNDNNGTSTASDFTLSLSHSSGSTTSTQEFQGSENGVEFILEEGYYEVSENSATGYEASFYTGCSGKLSASSSITCTVTNDDAYAPPPAPTTATIIIVKNVINDNGGSAVPSDFSITLSALINGSTTNTTFNGSSTGTAFTIDAGSYSVIESKFNGNYTTSYSDECNDSISAGESKTCTVTNNDFSHAATGTLIVIKKVINDNFYTRTPEDFSITAVYTMPQSGDTAYPSSATTSVTFPGSSAGTILTIGTGDYSVTENEHPNYDAEYSETCVGTMNAGATITCFITNDDRLTTGNGSGSNSIDTNSSNSSSDDEEDETPGDDENSEDSSSGEEKSPSSEEGGNEEPSYTPSDGNSETSENNSTPTPRVSGTEDYSKLSCELTEEEALYVNEAVNSILSHLGAERDITLEEYFNAILTPRVVPQGLDASLLAAVQNYTNYGTKSNLRLGQGERAGVVDSFRAVYGRTPLDACDWQNAIKIANTKLPIILNTDREQQVEATFKQIYGRSSNRSNQKDDIAINIMTYGIRPQIRDLDAERKAIQAFEKIFNKKPSNATEWDTNRAMAYSGIPHSFLPEYLQAAISRIKQIN